MAYIVTSAKTEQAAFEWMADAFRFAIRADEEFQPAGGVDITDEDSGDTYTADGGRIAIEVIADEDTEQGAVILAGDDLVIAWDQGIRTPFDSRSVVPA